MPLRGCPENCAFSRGFERKGLFTSTSKAVAFAKRHVDVLPLSGTLDFCQQIVGILGTFARGLILEIGAQFRGGFRISTQTEQRMRSSDMQQSSAVSTQTSFANP
jgi:hypothetical protein